ncbi:MAG: AMP-binding protein [Clostridiales Family XIII bacterium]|jgi:fatty-acyl-CoA synthase|nr:AMP-binding protein [Clostridiales Family XIII bacterium]
MDSMLGSIPDLYRFRARQSGGKEAVYDYAGQKRYTYDELYARAEKLGAFLTEVLKLRKGDRVAFVSQNAVPFIDCFFMSYRTGIIMTAYNCMMGGIVLDRLVSAEGPRVIFYSAPANRKDAIEGLRAHEGIEFITIAGERDERDRYSYRDILDYVPDGTARYETPDFEDVQMLIHTGGTTGTPKAAMLSYRAVFFNAASQILTIGIGAGDTMLTMLPFFHTAGWNSPLTSVLMSGGRVVLIPFFDAETALRAIREERPTVNLAVETIYRYMAAHPDFAGTDFSCFRWMLSGAAPITRETMEIYWKRGVKLMNAYGMTEVGPSNLVPPVNEITQGQLESKWSSAGKPMFFNEVRIVDEKGRDVPAGEQGELLFKGLLTFSGYWGNEEQTQAIFRDGWIKTGDIAYADADGYYCICGRKKNMFISAGENIFPAEIERAFCMHPACDAVCVIGVPDEKWGEVGKALVVLKPGHTVGKEELKQFVRGKTAPIKTPKYIRFLRELPKNAMDKIDLRAIRSLYGMAGESETKKTRQAPTERKGEKMDNVSKLQELNKIQSKAVRAWKEGGGKAIGTFCCHVPEEIIHAAGMLPVRIRATGCTDGSGAEVWMSPFTCSYARSCFQYLLDGAYDFLDGIISSDGCLTAGKLDDNSRNIPSIAGGRFIKKIEAPRIVGERQTRFYAEELEMLRADLEKYFGAAITDEKLNASIALYNETRALIRQLYELRLASEPVISASETLEILLAGMTMPKEDFNKLLCGVLSDAESRPPIRDSRARLMFIGSALDDPEYLRVIERQGGYIAFDATCYGSRYLWEPVEAKEGEPPIEALARCYLARPTCPRSMNIHDALLDFILKAYRDCRAEGIVFARLQFCEIWGGESAFFDKLFKQENIPYITLDREEIMTNAGQLAVRAEAFVEMLEGGREP